MLCALISLNIYVSFRIEKPEQGSIMRPNIYRSGKPSHFSLCLNTQTHTFIETDARLRKYKEDGGGEWKKSLEEKLFFLNLSIS
jgi:hypothetical protein